MGQKCREAFQSESQMLFGIVQGGTLPELRRYSAEETVKIGFDGYAIGGLSVGEPKPIMYSMIDEVEPYLPKSQARYLMGVGSPDSIIEGVRRGIDMFDCVLPTRNARNSALLTWSGRMNIDRLEYSRDSNPIDTECQCYTCKNFLALICVICLKPGNFSSRIGYYTQSFFMVELLNRIRKAILNGSFRDLSSDLFARFQGQIVN